VAVFEGAEEGDENVKRFWIADFGFWIKEKTHERDFSGFGLGFCSDNLKSEI
jgi:hypothetical protein